jgi:hypothetical protein
MYGGETSMVYGAFIQFLLIFAAARHCSRSPTARCLAGWATSAKFRMRII